MHSGSSSSGSSLAKLQLSGCESSATLRSIHEDKFGGPSMKEGLQRFNARCPKFTALRVNLQVDPPGMEFHSLGVLGAAALLFYMVIELRISVKIYLAPS